MVKRVSFSTLPTPVMIFTASFTCRKDFAAIDSALTELTNAWQTASQNMYQQAGPGQPGAGANPFNGANGPFGGQQGPQGPQGGNEGNGGKDDNVTDVDFEEVK